LQVGFNRIDVLLLFLHRVGIVETEVELAAELLRDGVIEQ
jgi:hypothetical protein